MIDKSKGQQMKLEDGRTLGYAEYGSPEGKPVFYFHGFPSSRLDWQLTDPDDTAGALNARIIAPDRPGYGLSDYQRGRKLLDWPQDVLELDGQLLEQPALAETFIEGMREAFRGGTKRANQEAGLYKQPWGFELQEITGEVHLWHGEEDLNVPVSAGPYVAKALPNGQARFLEGEGHLTLPHNHIREFLSVLVN